MGTRNQAPTGVLVTTTSTGTGTYSIGAAAVTGYFHPSDVSPTLNGVRVGYVAVDSLTSPTIREEGEGVLTSAVPWTLSRATIRRTLSAGVAGSSAINWAAGTKYIYLTPLNAQTVLLDTDGWLHTGGDLILANAGSFRISINSAGVISVADSAAWRSGLGVPATPTGAVAAGYWPDTIRSGTGAAAVLPASGTWAWRILRIASASGNVDTANCIGGISAGGSTVGAAAGGFEYLTECWRIA